MSTSAPAALAAPTGAETVRWNLADLYPDEAALDADLAAAEAEATEIAAAYRGRVGALAPAALAAMYDAMGRVHDRAGRASTYAFLAWSTATDDPARGALLQRVREATTRIGQQLLFADVEWAAVEPAEAAARLEDPALAPVRHYLELQTAARAHVLSEPEEAVLAEKAVTGAAAWDRFFDETISAARVALPDGPAGPGGDVPLDQALARLHAPDRAARRAAAEAITDTLGAVERPVVFVFNTLLADKASTDRLRGYATWDAARHQANETDAAAVDALVEAVTGRYGLVHRYYRLKGRLLGHDLADSDRYAPLPGAAHTVVWDDARALVTDAYARFHPEMGAIVERFFDERWIDAPPGPGKRGGAFSHGAVPSAHPYILLNYTGRPRDVATLAHELGHGVHQFLARGQGVYHADTPLTTAETASVFGERLAFETLLARTDRPADRLALVMEKIDDSMATVFRQITMNRFEARIHTHRRERGELTPDDFAGHWMETQAAMYGDSVTLTDGYRRWWSYIPHFVGSPGYVYAYAFGELLVLALYARYQAVGPDFAAGYRDLLAAGGSDYPHVLAGRLGVDLHDAGFWDAGLDAIEALVAEAERLERAAGASAT